MKQPYTLPVRDQADDEDETDLFVPDNAIPPSNDKSFEDDEEE